MAVAVLLVQNILQAQGSIVEGQLVQQAMLLWMWVRLAWWEKIDHLEQGPGSACSLDPAAPALSDSGRRTAAAP